MHREGVLLLEKHIDFRASEVLVLGLNPKTVYFKPAGPRLYM